MGEQLALRLPRGMGRRALERKFQKSNNASTGWIAAPVIVTALIGIPLAVVLFHLGGFFSSEMQHLLQTVLPRYIGTTVALVSLVAILCAVVGIGTAWLVTVYDFPGRRILSWLLVLPLAIPTYIGALAYTGLLDYTGPVQLFFREVLELSPDTYPTISLRGFGGLAFILTTLFYPYTYLTSRAAFLHQGAGLLEVTRSLGNSGIETLFRAALPAARPALVGGVMLVAMETLSEFGASHYLGVDTLTIGIFRGWFGLGNVRIALALGALMLIIIAVLQTIEHRHRGAARFSTTILNDRPLVRRILHRRTALVATAACLLPVITGFALPAGQLAWWASHRMTTFFNSELLRLTATSLSLASLATVFTILLATLVAYTNRIRKERFVGVLSRWSSAGYAVPAAVLAVGIATAYTWIDHQIKGVALTIFGVSPGLILTASGLALVGGYITRFFAIGYHAIESGFTRIPERFNEVSQALGHSPGSGLLHVVLPNIRPAVLTASILIVVEMLKELPLTLILRPFRIETLSTNVFRLAGNEQLAEAAPFAIVILICGLVPVLILNRIVAATNRQAALPAEAVDHAATTRT